MLTQTWNPTKQAGRTFVCLWGERSAQTEPGVHTKLANRFLCSTITNWTISLCNNTPSWRLACLEQVSFQPTHPVEKFHWWCGHVWAKYSFRLTHKRIIMPGKTYNVQPKQTYKPLCCSLHATSNSLLKAASRPAPILTSSLKRAEGLRSSNKML